MTEQAFASVWGLSYASETAGQLELALSEPLAATGFERLQDDLGAASWVSILLATRKVSFNEGLDLPLEALAAVNRGCPSRTIAASPRSSTSTSSYGRFEVDLEKRIDFEPRAA